MEFGVEKEERPQRSDGGGELEQQLRAAASPRLHHGTQEDQRGEVLSVGQTSLYRAVDWFWFQGAHDPKGLLGYSVLLSRNGEGVLRPAAHQSRRT